MAGRERITLGVRLALVLAMLAVLFVGVVYLTILDSERMIAQVNGDLALQTDKHARDLEQWFDRVEKAHARQLAAPFLYDIDTLEALSEDSPAFEKLQRRMTLFVFGRREAPAVTLPSAGPIGGPLESVLIVDPSYRIVAASNAETVDWRFTDPKEIETFEKALVDGPQVKIESEEKRSDGKSVRELTVAVPNSQGANIGFVRLRYVGRQIAKPPMVPAFRVTPEPSMWGPVLAGLVALLGVGFGALATAQVIALTRRIEATAQGVRLPRARGPGGEALSLIEERLESLSNEVRRDDLLVESLTEALREGVVMLDPEGQPVTANRQAIAMLQASDRSEVSQASFQALLELNPELAMVVHQGLEKRRAVRDKAIVLQLPAGRDVAVQVTTYVLRDGERTAGILLVLKDRASIETLERNLLEASKLQSIVRLTGSVAHEVKNPLGAIGIHLENLRRRLVKIKSADPAAQERLEVLREEIDRLREILDEWLELTAPEERAPAHAAVNEVLDSVARLLRVEARHQGVDLIVEQEGEPGQVTLSTARLRQVLLNLSLNALQVMPDGGRLVLRSRGAGDDAELQVEDTGPGIPEELREKIFDFHFTTREGGSGLGLSICKRLIENAKGTLSFESEPGRGTRFSIRLPKQETVRDGRQQGAEAGTL